MSLIVIRFADQAEKRKAPGFLLGRFSVKSWATGEVTVPDCALPALVREGISFTAEGPATDERLR
jgi:hypothetical protein